MVQGPISKHIERVALIRRKLLPTEARSKDGNRNIFIYLFLNKRADFEVNPAPMGIITFIYYFCLLFLAMSFAIN